MYICFQLYLCSACKFEKNGPSGEIASIGYPRPAPRSNSFCNWIVRVPEGRRVTLNILDFDPEPSRDNMDNMLWVSETYLSTEYL